MELSGAEREALASGSYRLAVFIRLGTEPPLNAWVGLGPIRLQPGQSTLDPDGVVYQGFGKILNIPVMRQMVNGGAERIDTGVSIFDNQILTLASYANAVQGKTHDVGVGLMNESWALIGTVHWIRHYVADFLTISVTPSADPEGETVKSAVLSSGSAMTDRKRPGWSYFNNQDQQARSSLVNPSLPKDQSCERTVLYSVTGQKTWPKY